MPAYDKMFYTLIVLLHKPVLYFSLHTATCEMIAIMQEYGEVVLCVGSSLNIQNIPIFLLADCR